MSGKPSLRSVGAWLAGLYLGLQLLIPLCVISQGELSSRDFSWDMFSYQLNCEALDIRTSVAGRPWQSARLDRDFSSWAQLRRVLSEKRFGDYAQKLCSDLHKEQGGTVELHIGSRCTIDRDAHAFEILDSDRDFCMTR